MSEVHLAYAVQLRDGGATAAEIVAKTGLTPSTLYRRLPARPADPTPPAHTPTVSAAPYASDMVSALTTGEGRPGPYGELTTDRASLHIV